MSTGNWPRPTTRKRTSRMRGRVISVRLRVPTVVIDGRRAHRLHAKEDVVAVVAQPGERARPDLAEGVDRPPDGAVLAEPARVGELVEGRDQAQASLEADEVAVAVVVRAAAEGLPAADVDDLGAGHLEVLGQLAKREPDRVEATGVDVRELA